VEKKIDLRATAAGFELFSREYLLRKGYFAADIQRIGPGKHSQNDLR
jgi:hypothetical protein